VKRNKESSLTLCSHTGADQFALVFLLVNYRRQITDHCPDC